MSELLITPATAQEDSINKMWSAYMNESGEYDKRVTDVWRKDTSDIISFVSPNTLSQCGYLSDNVRKAVGLSSTVAAVLVESYEKLSLDTGNHSPHSPTTSIICINTVWALSLVLSLTSALLAILIRQWVRRYIELPLSPRLSSERARVRSYLFLGTVNFGMHHAVEAAPMLLHLSLLLFFIGLVMFFFHRPQDRRHRSLHFRRNKWSGVLHTVNSSLPLSQLPIRYPGIQHTLVSMARFHLFRSVLPSVDPEATSCPPRSI
jgi:hypothetical protein